MKNYLKFILIFLFLKAQLLSSQDLPAITQESKILEKKITLSAFREIFSTSMGRKKIASFLKNIKVDLDIDKLFVLISDLLSSAELSTDQEFYLKLREKIGQTQYSFLRGISKKLVALKNEKEELSQITADLIKESQVFDKKSINGIIEIGLPGRYLRPLQEKLSIKGKSIVIADKKPSSLSDRLQAGGISFAHDQFLPLSHYAPVKLAKKSIDLITVPIGLHHASEKQLAKFIPSLREVLSDHGVFVLRDHNVVDSLTASLATAVHTIINAQDGVSLDEEREELRNFKALSNWVQLLEIYGFELIELSGKNCRVGDPTKNCVYLFKKKLSEFESKLILLKKKLNNKNYYKNQAAAYFTVAEWHNVDVPKQYANFLKDKKFSDFSYLKHTHLYWQVFYRSWQQAKKQDNYQNLDSIYMSMNLFLGTFCSLEYLLKSLSSVPILLIDYIFQKKASNLDKVLGKAQKDYQKAQEDYANFIPDTPFVHYHFMKDLSRYLDSLKSSWSEARNMGASRGSILANSNFFISVYTGGLLALESSLKALLSWPLRAFFPNEKELVGFIIQDSDGSLKYLESDRGYHFKTAVQVLSEDEGKTCEEVLDLYWLDNQASKNNHSLDLNLLLSESLERFQGEERRIIEICGQTKVQLKLKARKKAEKKDLKNLKYLYSTEIIEESEFEYLMMEVSVLHLIQVVRDIKKNQDFDLDFIYYY